LSTLRKHRLTGGRPQPRASAELDIREHGSIYFTSESPAHPIEHLLDGQAGPGATYWASDRPDTTEEILLVFDSPRRIAQLAFEVEESKTERTQEIRAEYSSDGGEHFCGLFTQEYTFSPSGATFQRETLSFDLQQVTHLRLSITPNKRGSGCATLTSLRLFS
jgi:F5/8 type C domain-containing protein